MTTKNSIPAATYGDRPVNVESLREAALAATKGNWTLRTHPDGQEYGCFVSAPREQAKHAYDIEVLGEDETQYSTRMQDLNYLVAAQPGIVLALLSEVEQLRFAMAQRA